MTSKIVLASGVAALAALAFASAGTAQTTAAPVTNGPPISGLCIVSVNQAISTSTVGKYVGQRMDQLVQQVKAELAPEEASITTEGRALDAARPTLDAASFDRRATALRGRIQALQQKEDLRQKEIQATEQKSVNRIAQELDPVVRQLYQQNRCSALLDKGSVLMANPAMDLTPAAITGVNARIQQFAIEREHLDTAAAAAPGR
ncbi:MAG TPA: OmpH family outer membrane protein [Caulobacteraceae bacterium]